MNLVGVRCQGSGIRNRESLVPATLLPAMYRMCPGCNWEFYGRNRYCESCLNLVARSDEAAEQKPADCVRTGPANVSIDLRPARRLFWSNAFYATATIAVMLLLLWETRSFWIDWFEMWFGGQ